MSMEKRICPYCGSQEIGNIGGIYICWNCRRQIDPDMGISDDKAPSCAPNAQEKAPVKPQRIFISYGHPQSEICRRIRKALEERGHEVWFDETRLHHGQNWREQIADGIVQSNGVISFLSRHSVRDPGVCLDELSIAVGVRGGNIKTVLLESEKEVCPPASVCHIQWLDMSDWKRRMEQGEAAFEPWFAQKMQELFGIIESEKSREFAGQIAAIREKLQVRYDTSKQNNLLKRRFVGREWLTARIEAWLDDADGDRLCVLYGDPGVGKSAFAAHYMHYNARVAAGLFCEYDRPHYNDARTVTMTLAYLLACRLPDYRTVLSDVLEKEEQLGRYHPSELFDLLLATPLTSMMIDGGRETLCIVIDALDECAQGEQNALAQTLAQYVPRLPKWLRVLVTAREVSAVTEPMEGAFHIDLHGEEAQNLADVRAYFCESLRERFGGEPGFEEAIDALAARSAGIFLYAQLVTQGVLENKIALNDVSAFPEGLSGAFYSWFGWFFPDQEEYKKNFRMPLGVLLAAPEPLPEQELQRIFEWDDNDVNDFLRRIDVLLIKGANEFRERTYTFSHQYLSEWLDTPGAGCFRTSKAAALRTMADRFYAFYQNNGISLYETLHLAHLLEQSGNASAYAEMMMDQDFFGRVLDTGDFLMRWGALTLALRCFNLNVSMTQMMVRERGALNDYGNLAASYERVAQILSAQDDPYGAKELYEKAHAIEERLVQERGEMQDRRSLCIGCLRLGDNLYAENELDGAKAYYEKALTIGERLVLESATVQARRDLSICYSKVGRVMHMQNNLQGAKEFYERALAIQERLAQELGTPEECRDLGISYNDIAIILKKQGDLEGAKKLHEKALAIREQVVQERGMPDDREDMAISCEHLADILKEQGDAQDAKKLYENALALRERVVLARGTPNDRRSLNRGYSALAELLKEWGDQEGAKELYRKTIEGFEQLIHDGKQTSDRRNLSVVYGRMGDVLFEQDDLQGAKKLHEKALVGIEQLVCEYGEQKDRRNLVVSYIKLGIIAQAEGDLQNAKELFEKGAAISEQLVQACAMPEDLKGLGVSYCSVADVLQEQNDLQGARAMYEKGNVILNRLVQERGAIDDCINLCINCESIADVLMKLGEQAQAEEMYTKSLVLAEAIVQRRGTPADYRSLRNKYGKTADALQTRGDMENAKALHEKRIAVGEELVRARGTLSDYRSLDIGYNALADVLQAQGELDGAKEQYEKGVALCERLVQEFGDLWDLRQVFFGRSKIAGILKEQSDLQGALELHRQANAIAERLVQERGTRQDRMDLACSCDSISYILDELGDAEGAQAMYDKASALLEEG